MRRFAGRLLGSLILSAVGCRSGVPPVAPAQDGDRARARDLLCGDVGERICREACSDALSRREHAECLLAFRFASDPEALELARDLYGNGNALVGIDVHRTIGGFQGEAEVALFPALPVGEDRRHLSWIRASLESFDAFIDALAPHAPEPVAFDRRPSGFVFYRTAGPSYPSAYCADDLIAYNLDGPLHTGPRDVLETLFHELFHVNDARRRTWSETALAPIFATIVDHCGDDHACFRPFAPHHTLVPGGTFYGFDRRTRDVREYAAELALRYYLEHEAILAGKPPLSPFKCLTPENQRAWSLLAREFFGSADLTANCDGI